MRILQTINLTVTGILLVLLATVSESFVVSPTSQTTNIIRSTANDVHLSAVNHDPEFSRRTLVQSIIASSLALPAIIAQPEIATARLEAVNRPDLLPSEKGLNVIQTEKFLTSGQARRINDMLGNLEKDTGFRVKVLCQNYPNTPGLAIRDYWSLGKDDQKDDKYIVLIVDQFGGRGNVLNFNVGDVSYNRKSNWRNNCGQSTIFLCVSFYRFFFFYSIQYLNINKYLLLLLTGCQICTSKCVLDTAIW
jgi:hypothetical protein